MIELQGQAARLRRRIINAQTGHTMNAAAEAVIAAAPALTDDEWTELRRTFLVQFRNLWPKQAEHLATRAAHKRGKR